MVGIKEIYKRNMGSSLAEEAYPVNKEICKATDKRCQNTSRNCRVWQTDGCRWKQIQWSQQESRNDQFRNIKTIKIFEDRNTVGKELQAVKILLEAGEFDKDMHTDEKVSNEAS